MAEWDGERVRNGNEHKNSAWRNVMQTERDRVTERERLRNDYTFLEIVEEL